VALIVMAAPPFSFAVDAVFGFVFVAWFFTRRMTWSGVARLRTVSAGVLVVMLLLLTSSELMHRRIPRIEGSASDHLVVIGDSISAGSDPRIPNWPAIFESRTGMGVKNLSQPGAGVADALMQASQVQPQDTLLLLEIGGNDLLSGGSSAEFGQNLDSLLAKLSRTDRTLVMFELPLLPNKIGYGRSQRKLAARYHVFLVPKHYFTDVISGPSATTDGLHLSEVGAHRMATLVAQLLAPDLKPGSSKTGATNCARPCRSGRFYPTRLSAPAATALALGFLTTTSGGAQPRILI
jgi:lysophospholipase L1-like esterase